MEGIIMGKSKVPIIKSILIALVIILTCVNQANAQEEQVKLIWEHKALGAVDHISVSPDYRYIAIASNYNDKNVVYLLNVSGKLVWHKNLGDKITDISVSQNGSLIVVGYGNVIEFFDKTGNSIFSNEFGHWRSEIDRVEEKEVNGQVIKVVIGKSDYVREWVYSVSSSYNGEYVAVAAGSKVYLFSRTGEKLWEYDIKLQPIVAAISPNGEFVVVGSYKPDSKIYLFNKNGNLLKYYKINDSVSTIRFCSDDKRFVVGSGDGHLYGFDKTQLQWKFSTDQKVSSLHFSPNCEYVVFANEYENVYVLNKDGKLVQHYKIASQKIYSVSLFENRRDIIIGTHDHAYMINIDGEIIWRYRTTWNVIGIFIHDGDVIIGSDKVYYFYRPKVYAEALISRAESRIEEIKNEFNVTQAIKYLKLAKKYFMDSEYDEAQKYAKKSLEITNDAVEIGKYVEKMIFEIEKLINYLQEEIDTSCYNRSVNQIKNKLAMGQYNSAKMLSEKLRSQLQSIVTIKNLVDEARTSTNDCSKTPLYSKESYNLLSQAKDYLSKAEQNLKTGNYSEAKKFAELTLKFVNLAKNKSTEAKKEFLEAKDMIIKAEKAISESKSLGFDVEEAESLIYQAKKLLNEGKYKEARSSAERGYSIAVDIDQDGVSNTEDIIPYINNNILIVLLILLLIAISISLKIS